MKGAIVLVTALVAGTGYVVTAHPQLMGETMTWATRAWAVDSATVTPTVRSSPAVVTTPAVDASTVPPVALVTPAAPTATPVPTAVPRPLFCLSGWVLENGDCFPPGSVQLWNAANCSWASGVLSWDRQLDLAEAAAVANGTDTRYGTGPAEVAYYATYADRWTVVLGEVTAACSSSPAWPTPTEVATARQWFTIAINAHRSDEAAAGGPATQDGAWDAEWIGYYQRLQGMYANIPS